MGKKTARREYSEIKSREEQDGKDSTLRGGLELAAGFAQTRSVISNLEGTPVHWKPGQKGSTRSLRLPAVLDPPGKRRDSRPGLPKSTPAALKTLYVEGSW